MQLQVFAKDGVEIRVFMVDDKPYFVAKDVALALGYTNPREAIRDHVREKHRPNAYSLGGAIRSPYKRRDFGGY